MPRSEPDDIAIALLPFVRSFTGTIGGGQRWFQILCSVPACRREDHVSTSSHGIQSERKRQKASRNLASRGWKCPDNPVCPDCARKMFNSVLAPTGASSALVSELPPNKSLERTRER
jgi:hypothetical protein